jgi:hypothetical protein
MEMFVEFVWEHYYYGRPLKSSAGDEGGRGAVLLPPADDLRAETDEEEEEKNAWRTFRRMATDLRHPHAWYPLARALPGGRRIVLHVGPTNRHAHTRAFPSLVRHRARA